MKNHTSIVILVLAALILPAIAMAQPQTELGAARALEGAMVNCIEKAEQSVVAIVRGRKGERDNLEDPRFVPFEYSTGVVVDAQGLILTNYHTLGEVSRNDYVVWTNGKSYSKVEVKAADPWTDLAILEIAARDLKPIEFGDATKLKKGRIVIALGNPHGIARDGEVSATWGIVANVNRKIDGPLMGVKGQDRRVSPRDRETRYHFGGLIQTDAKLARGTSGGPLLDLNGKMVGLSTSVAMLAGFEKGVGYAIPVNDGFIKVLEKLKRGEEIEQGFLGVAPRNPDPSYGEVGVMLEMVQPGAPAGRSGLYTNDEIVQIDEHLIRNIDDLFMHVGSAEPEHVALVKVKRGQEFVTLPVQLTKKPWAASRPSIATKKRSLWRGMAVDYATTKRVATLDVHGCVVVSQVQKDSAAWKAGIRIGQVINAIGGKHRVTTPNEFYEHIESLEGEVSLSLYNLGGDRTLVVSENKVSSEK